MKDSDWQRRGDTPSPNNPEAAEDDGLQAMLDYENAILRGESIAVSPGTDPGLAKMVRMLVDALGPSESKFGEAADQNSHRLLPPRSLKNSSIKSQLGFEN